MHNARQRETTTEPNPNNPGSPIFKAKRVQTTPDPIEAIAELDANRFRTSLETSDLQQSVAFLISLMKAGNHRMSMMQRDIDEVRRHLIQSTIYTFIDWEDRYIKIGWSDNFEKPKSGRKDTHLRAGLEYLAHTNAPKIREDDLKALLKALNIEPRRGTKEEFKVTKELLDVLVSLRWPLGDDPYSLLDDTRQGNFL